jgi:ribonucleotide reductase alpha subunit
MFNDHEMNVKKRNGQLEIVSFDKILKRIKKVGQEVQLKLNYTSLAMKVIDQLYDGISTFKIDELTAEQCASMSSIHPEYNILAGRITISNHHKNTSTSFVDVMTKLYQYRDKHDKPSPLVSEYFLNHVKNLVKHLGGKKELDKICIYDRDYLIEYFGFKTLEKSYLFRINGKIVERPQHMWLRVAIAIHGSNFDKVLETYEHMSQKYFTHATPTLFNAGTPHSQLSSCYLLSMETDSIDGIFNTLKDCALISKWAGGIGLHIHNVRATGSHIRGTNGSSNGIVPMLKVFNNTAKYVDQCVHPTSLIYTTEGPKEIQYCHSNETQVYNLSGNVEVIQNVLEHKYEGTVLKISTKCDFDELMITPQHPVFVLSKPESHLNKLQIINLLEKQKLKLEWKDAGELEEGDFIVYRIPDYSNDQRHITEEDCMMYGIILENGIVNQSGSFELRFPIERARARKFAIEYLNKKYVDHVLTAEEHTNINIVSWNSAIQLPFRYSDFYKETGQKFIHPMWLNLPVYKIRNILKGILWNDICNTEDVVFKSKSRLLSECVRFLLLKIEILARCYYDYISKPKKIQYLLHIPKTNVICELLDIPLEYEYGYIDYRDTRSGVTLSSSHFMKYNRYLLAKIEYSLEEEYNGTLYDLQMKHEHNYLLANGGIVHNGGGKRNGSFAIYLEPWHADIVMFLQMRKNHGDEELKARDLFYALWIPDLFMERVKSNGKWTLMCPDECPGLSDVYGADFVKLYEKYESEGKGRETMNARDLWFQVLDAQMETGTPYLLYKDPANQKSNQKNLGTIKSSNLCVAPETVVLTDKGHVEIRTLENQTVNVWNGEEFSEVTVKKTGENQSLIRVTTSDGSVLSCTPYHKFYIQEIDGIRVVEAKDLSKNDRIIRCEFPVIDGTMENANPKFCSIPSGFCSIKDKVDWFHKIFVDCGFICKSRRTLCISNFSKKYLLRVKLLLQTCGINAKLEHDSILEVDQLVVSLYDLQKLIGLGFPSDEDLEDLVLHVPSYDDFVQIVSVDDHGRLDDTFCFTEPKRHMGVFNGILTGQCTEIIEYSDDKETAVCNLASIALPTFVDKTLGQFDYQKLHHVAKLVTENLNKIIDINYYPTEKTKTSNFRHRPIGIGVQGLADVFLMLGLSFSSDAAKKINRDIFETIYHAALEQSMELAVRDGAYETFKGSPASQGILQFDMWNVDPGVERYDWNDLKRQIQEKGLRNSLLLAPMPTASTSQILGFNECIEPITSNIYSRRTLAGEFILVNKYLMNDLIALDMWNETLKNNMIANNGSIQHIETIPLEIREKYRTVWEIPMRHLIDMSADRGVFICQSQSLNLWQEDPNYNTLTSMHFYAWSKGLKTGIYYLRRRPKHQAQQFTIEPEKARISAAKEEICEMCSA